MDEILLTIVGENSIEFSISRNVMLLKDAERIGTNVFNDLISYSISIGTFLQFFFLDSIKFKLFYGVLSSGTTYCLSLEEVVGVMITFSLFMNYRNFLLVNLHLLLLVHSIWSNQPLLFPVKKFSTSIKNIIYKNA